MERNRIRGIYPDPPGFHSVPSELHTIQTMSAKTPRIPPFSTGFMLVEACPQLVDSLIDSLNEGANPDLAEQVKRAFVPIQGMSTSHAEDFSFMAYPLPRITIEQRKIMQLGEEKSINVQLLRGRVRIAIDEFGQINWFYVIGSPETYAEVKEHMKKSPTISLKTE